MLLPELKEREYRFKLALRMGLPIFALIFALISHTLISSYESLDAAFYVESVLLLVFSIYFLFYLIYKGFNVKITDSISKTFSREYLYEYLKKEIQKEKKYTLVLISIDNLSDINERYGIKNGDKIIYETAQWIADFFIGKNITNFPIGHMRSANFIIGLPDTKTKYTAILELLCLKASELKLNDIEIKLSTSMADTSYSNELDHLIEKLFELQNIKRTTKRNLGEESELNPSELEFLVTKAVNEQNILFMMQDIYENDKPVAKECFVKLKTADEKIIHQKNYMKILNQLGLMLHFDLMILEKLTNEYMPLDDAIYALSISPTSIRNRIFQTKIKEMMLHHGYLKERLILLLSESEYYAYVDKYKDTLNSLRQSGIFIAIDRLGSLHASYLYLRDLEVDYVRFDSLYTKEIKKRKFKTIMEGFNFIVHNNTIKSWIKMIEDEESYNLAKEMQIDYMQGKYLASLETYEPKD
jgi:EAL domain-containing protein (putative c-di-GMP-specific phosphodiesterase class I)/GGDEF domain-containing protein